MTVVAKRRRLRALAGAELHRAVPRCLPFHRLEDRTLMRAVTEGLAVGATAAAPPVAFARHDVDNDRLVSANLRLVSHSFPLRPQERDGIPSAHAPCPAPPALQTRCSRHIRESGPDPSA